MTSWEILPTRREDGPALTRILQQTGLFPAELLPDMLEPAISGQAQDLWLTCRRPAGAIGFCYGVPEQMTNGVWNLLAIAVAPEHQRQGIAEALVKAVETQLQDQRLLLVDTSATDEFATARRLYLRLGFDQEARIRDYWARGDDKITFRKALHRD